MTEEQKKILKHNFMGIFYNDNNYEGYDDLSQTIDSFISQAKQEERERII